jgi:hypothetical protein
MFTPDASANQNHVAAADMRQVSKVTVEMAESDIITFEVIQSVGISDFMITHQQIYS